MNKRMYIVLYYLCIIFLVGGVCFFGFNKITCWRLGEIISVNPEDIMTVYNENGDAVWGKEAGNTQDYYQPDTQTYNTPVPPKETAKKCEHDYQLDNEKSVKATCKDDGKNVWKCSKCGATKSEDVKASDEFHIWENVPEEFVPATCSTKEVVVSKCSVCGEKMSVENDAVGDHVYEDTTIEATCTEEGKIVHTCTLCGHTEEETIPTIPHAYEERIAKESTYFTTGVKESACVMCGEVEHTELIPALWETWQQVVVICIPVVIIALGIVLAIVIKKKRR